LFKTTIFLRLSFIDFFKPAKINLQSILLHIFSKLVLLMKKTILFIFSLLMTGCALIPKTHSELLNSKTNTKYCYSESQNVVNERIKSYLVSCYTNATSTTAASVGGAYIPINIDIFWEVEEESGPVYTSYYLKSEYGYVLAALTKNDVENKCGTAVEIYAVNTFWSDRFATLNKVAKNEQADCPYRKIKPKNNPPGN